MTDFSERERGFEKKFELDEEMKFKVASRAAKLLGIWVAGQMGLQHDSAASYAQDVVAADLAHPHHDDLFAKIEADLIKFQITITRQQLVKTYEMYLDEARKDLAG
jgi:hypothetical protein